MIRERRIQGPLAPRRVTALAILGLLLPGCASRPPVPLRPEPLPYADTLPIEPPDEVEPAEIERLLTASVGGEIGRALSLRRWLGARHEAMNLTRFDDVVSSAWFEHRNGRTPMTPEEVARGPTLAPPDTSRTLIVTAGKGEGISPGFTIRDAKGDTYLFKFDPKSNLHLASAAGVISSRLFFAAGYHTPEDYIVVFDSSRLVLDPQAEITTAAGDERPMAPEDIAAVLDLTDPLSDGRFLALASKFVAGRPLGPFYFSGRKQDDPNDYYYHEHRRELRGLYVLSSWLNHVDMRFANTLDVFIDPPGYVRHYLIDFAATLGSGTIRSHNPREGTEYNFDFWASVGRIFSFGFYERGWEEMAYTEIHPALGWIPVETFEPGKWKPNWPNAAFGNRTERDGYWGAKLVGSFTDEQIAAAVTEGQLPDPAPRYLTRIIAQRRDRIVRYWYARVTPIENPTVSPSSVADGATLSVSFDDLGLAAGVWRPDETRYSWRLEDPASRSVVRGERSAAPGFLQTLLVQLPEARPTGRTPDSPRFATLRIRAIRPGAAKRDAIIHLRWKGPEAGYEVVGLEH